MPQKIPRTRMTTRKGKAIIFLVLATMNLLAAICVLLHAGRQIDREKVIRAHSALLIEIPADAIETLKTSETTRALSATFNSSTKSPPVSRPSTTTCCEKPTGSSSPSCSCWGRIPPSSSAQLISNCDLATRKRSDPRRANRGRLSPYK